METIVTSVCVCYPPEKFSRRQFYNCIVCDIFTIPHVYISTQS